MVCCVFAFQTPQRGDSNKYTQDTIFYMERKVTIDYSKSAAMELFQGTAERVRNSRGKRAIGVRVTDRSNVYCRRTHMESFRVSRHLTKIRIE